MDKSKIFLEFTSKFTDIDVTKKAEAFSLFNEIMSNDDSKYKEIEEFMNDCEVYNIYEFEDFMETLQEISDNINNQTEKDNNLGDEDIAEVKSEKVKEETENDLGEEEIEMVEKKPSLLRRLFARPKDEDFDDYEEEKAVVDNEVSTDSNDLGEEEIEIVEKKPSLLRRLFSRPKDEDFDDFEEEKTVVDNEVSTDSNDLGEEEIEMVEKKTPLLRRLFARPKYEDFDDFEENDEDILEKDNNIKEEKEEKIKKESKIKTFFKKLFKKKINDIGEEDIPLIEKEEKKNKKKNKNININNNEKNIEKPIKTRKISKTKVISSFVRNNYSHNSEIKEFIKLINVREDKDVIINDLFNYIINDKSATNEEQFLNKLYELCGLSKKSEQQIANEDRKKIEEMKKQDKQLKYTLNKKQEDKKEKPARNINKWNDKFLEAKKELFNKLDEQDRIFINDMMSECLNPGDPELDQMFNERKVNKAEIYKYLLNVEKIKILNVYENLNDYEKEFVNEMTAENITKNDPEFNQMLCEKSVNKDIIKKYADILENSKNYQNKIIADYKKHIVFETSMDLENKKVSELKETAIEKNIPNISKLNKKQLIQALEELNKMKLENADKQLGLIK